MKGPKSTEKGVLIDVQTHETGGLSVVDLFIRTLPDGTLLKREDWAFPPYLYVSLVPSAEPTKIAAQLAEETLPGGIKPLKITLVEREKVPYIQIAFARIGDLVGSREALLRYPFVQALHESNIPYTRRYLLDKQLTPYRMVEWETDTNGFVKKIQNVEGEIPPLRTGAFDIETYGTHKQPEPERDDIISIAVASGAGNKVFIQDPYHDAHTTSVADEKALIEQFAKFTQLADLDVLYTYNGDHFDFQFIHARAKKFNARADFGFGPVQLVGKAGDTSARLHGVQHVDVYQLVRLMTRFAYFKSPRMDLESVMRAVFGEGEKTLSHKDILETWKTKKGLDKLAKYNLTDAEYTKRLGDEFLPLILELARLVGQPLYEVNRSTASQLVELLLFQESVKLNRMFPNPPTDEQVEGRNQNPIEGGYVKEPIAGLHTRLAVLDFRSLHPSIMISHNISPDTLDCAHPACKIGSNHAPTGHWFCTKTKGLFSNVLERILDARIEVQHQMDALPKKDPQQVMLKARKQALKIVLNSFFGTLAYPRFRWYSRESARAITAWSRHYIRQTLDWADEAGYKTVYADTDSCFMIVPETKTEEDVKLFVADVNKKLPGRMELEFEGFYQRGIFVTRKEGKAAKKRYALADFNGELTIVGFEYVRRDHSLIARETQKKVLQEILVNGDAKKAHQIVQEVVARLRAGKVPKKELVVLTQLQRRPESYQTTAPHVVAAQKAQKRGKEIHVGQLLGYIITAKGKTISDKAELEEFAKEGDYDAEYYISNQVIPAIEKIFHELGYDTADLVNKGKQTGLGSFV